MKREFTEFAEENQKIGRNKLKKELLKMFCNKELSEWEKLNEIYEVLKVKE